MKTLGIAIPTYVGHIQHLDRLLDSIQASTILPQQVSVSASQCDYKPTKKYGFELIITNSDSQQSTGKNRNIAADKLSTDIISFVDGDDLVQCQRNEFLLRAFDNGAEAVVHNYYETQEMDYEFLNSRQGTLYLMMDYIDTIHEETIYPYNKKRYLDFANGHLTISKDLFVKQRYDEDNEKMMIVDSLYTRALVESGTMITYIQNKLTLYYR